MNAKTFSAIAAALALVIAAGCASSKVTVKEMENKGTSMGVATPDWIKNYTASGISAVQGQSQYRDRYCIIGEESGVKAVRPCMGGQLQRPAADRRDAPYHHRQRV